jgi:hypothetical protein
VVVPSGDRPPAHYPGQDVGIALLQERFVAVELRGAKPIQLGLGEAPEQKIGLELAAIAALVEKALAARR